MLTCINVIALTRAHVCVHTCSHTHLAFWVLLDLFPTGRKVATRASLQERIQSL